MTAVESTPLPGTDARSSVAPLEIIVAVDSDAVRFARRISAMVNNTSVALYEASAAGVAVAPVGEPASTDGPVSLRFRSRNPAREVDALVREEITAIVASMATVLEVRTGT